MTACMGGWCRIRQACPRYHQIAGRGYAVERACLPGIDGKLKPIPDAFNPERKLPGETLSGDYVFAVAMDALTANTDNVR